MKILLLGEYSNVHWTLAEGLRSLGHQVTVISNGDFWKDYPRDINLTRSYNKLGGITYIAKLLLLLPRMRGYDIVQLINPMFLEIKAKRILFIYKYLRRHNGKIFLGAFGMDYYWVNTCRQLKQLRYSDFNIGDKLRTNDDAIKEYHDWIGTDKEILNKYIAKDCDRIITGLYEYWTCYHPYFSEKTSFIPFPIKITNESHITMSHKDNKVHIFIGINKSRSEYKGTDIMLKAAEDVLKKYPDTMKLIKVESVPFDVYQQLMNDSDAILDQLYSYTPSMNSLLAMSKGIICIGGGEQENYDIINETSLKPIINVQPTYKSVFENIEHIVTHPEIIQKLQQQSIEYVCKHHDYIKVARKYEEEYTKK